MTTVATEGAAERGRARPERTCAACRRASGADALLRLVRTPEGGVAVDWRRNLGGRGANVCPTRSCLAAAVRGRALERAFRAPVSYPEVEELVASARAGLERRLGALLCSAVGARRAAVGADAVGRAFATGGAACVLVASDAAERAEIERRAAGRGVPSRVPGDKAALGGLLGRRPTAVVAIGDRGLANAVRVTLERLEALK